MIGQNIKPILTILNSHLKYSISPSIIIKMKKNNTIQTQNFYRVKSIIAKRQNLGNLQYKVRWDGYSSKYDTWEPMENLDMVMDLIDQYESKNGGSNKISNHQIQNKGQTRRLLHMKYEEEDLEPSLRKLNTEQIKDQLPKNTHSKKSKQKSNGKQKSIKTVSKNKKNKSSRKLNVKKLSCEEANSKGQQQQNEEKLSLSLKDKPNKQIDLNIDSRQNFHNGPNDLPLDQNVSVDKKGLQKKRVYKKKTQNKEVEAIPFQLVLPKAKRINHIIMKQNKVFYEVEYEHIKNRPRLQLLMYEDMGKQCKQLVPKYYETVLTLLNQSKQKEEKQASEVQGNQILPQQIE